MPALSSRKKKTVVVALAFLVFVTFAVVYFFFFTQQGLDIRNQAGYRDTMSDMQRYWMFTPGNYWILEGTNWQQNEPIKTKIEVEREVEVNYDCEYKDQNISTPIRFSKSNYSSYWGGNSWSGFKDNELRDSISNGNVTFRFFIASALEYPGTSIYSMGGKMYIRNQSEPFAKTGWLADNAVYVPNEANPETPPYLYSLDSYDTYGEMLVPVTYQLNFLTHHYYDQADFSETLLTQNVATDPCEQGDRNFEFIGIDGMAGQFTDVVTPAYTGRAYVNVQTEAGQGYASWNTREDWYFAKDIGWVALKQKDFWQGNPQITKTYTGTNTDLVCEPDPSSCYCSNVFNPTTGDDPDCSITNSVRNLVATPMIDLELTKYYLGWPLEVNAANSKAELSDEDNSITVQRGSTFILDVKDSVKGFTYEGYVVPDTMFFSAETGKLVNGENAKVFLSDGKAEIYVSPAVNAQTITVRFTPLVTYSKADVENGTETLTDSVPDIDYSNTLTIRVVADNNTPTNIIGSDRYSIITSTHKSNSLLYPEPGMYEPFDARNLLKVDGDIVERVYQGTRFYMRSTSNDGNTWSDWYTDTVYGPWSETKSNNPTFPHPDTARPVDGYSLDFFGSSLQERVIQGLRYYTRESTDKGATWGDWYTDTLESAWSEGNVHPDYNKTVDSISYTKNTNGMFIEQVIQGNKIYQRRFNSDFTGMTSWFVVTTPVDETMDLGL